MHSTDQTNGSSPSTTWAWRRIKISTAPQANANSAAKPPRWWSLPRRDARQALTVRIKYRGGSECWYEIEARGAMGRFPGHVALHDAMSEINQSHRP